MPQKLAEKVSVFGFGPALGVTTRANRSGLVVLAAHPYPHESQYGTPEARRVRSIAHDLKHADRVAVRIAAASLAPFVPSGATLVPIPGSRGSTRENLALAEAIARLSGARVEDGLDRVPSESQYARRKRGLAPIAASAMQVRWTGRAIRGPVFLVDNVVTTGATAEAAARALGGGALLVWADARETVTRDNSGTAYSNPLLWEHAKREAVRRLGGRHSARAMQLAGRLYREAGGGYRGPRTAPQRSMARWTSERWTTATGEKACRKTPRGVRCDRYLPAEAWERLSPQEADATRRVKLRSPRQYVANAPAAREAAREAKRRG